jgi:hypothetical protein
LWARWFWFPNPGGGGGVGVGGGIGWGGVFKIGGGGGHVGKNGVTFDRWARKGSAS